MADDRRRDTFPSFSLQSRADQERRWSRPAPEGVQSARTPWRKMLDRIEEDNSVQPTPPSINSRAARDDDVEVLRQTSFEPMDGRDYGFVPGRHDTIAFDLDCDMRLTQRALSIDPLHGMQLQSEGGRTATTEALVRNEGGSHATPPAAIEVNPHSAKHASRPMETSPPPPVQSSQPFPVSQSALGSKDIQMMDRSDRPLPTASVPETRAMDAEAVVMEESATHNLDRMSVRRAGSLTPAAARKSHSASRHPRGSTSLTTSRGIHSDGRQWQHRATIDASTMKTPTKLVSGFVSTRKTLPPVRESGTATFEHSMSLTTSKRHVEEQLQHLTLRDFMRMAEIDLDDGKRRSSLFDADGMTAQPFKTQEDSLEQQLLYLSGNLVEEQVLRNVNSALKHMTHRTAKLSKEQEISFAQRNPPIVQQFTQSEGEALERMKTDLMCQISQCKMSGKQQWKQARCSLEQDRLNILKTIHTKLTKDSENLKEVADFLAWIQKHCMEAREQHRLREQRLKKEQQEKRSLEEKLHNLKKENEKLSEKKAALLKKQRQLHGKRQEKLALQSKLEELNLQRADDKATAREKKQRLRQISEAQLQLDMLHNLQPFNLRSVSEQNGTISLKMQCEKIFSVEISYSDQRGNGLGLEISIGLSPERLFSKFYSSKHIQRHRQLVSTLLGLSQDHGRVAIRVCRSSDLSELWMKLHSIQCLVDDLHALRLKSPPFVGYSFSGDRITLRFCNSKKGSLLTLDMQYKPYQFPFYSKPAAAQIKVVTGDQSLREMIEKQLCSLKEGPDVLQRIVDAVAL